MLLTRMPRCAIRASRRALSSGNAIAGRATSEVSSKKMRVGENGIAYKKVGSRLHALVLFVGSKTMLTYVLC